MKPGVDQSSADEQSDRVQRHALSDRLFHWSMAASVLVLLFTSFLPILGFKFAWVDVHWISGLVLTALIVWHIMRSLVWKNFGIIWYGLSDLKALFSDLGCLLKFEKPVPQNPGKYSGAQKLMHLVVSILILITIATGLIMMVKIDTPLWQRDPYWLSDFYWGVTYLLHGMAALSLISAIMIHIYFALRPENWMYTRAMIKGWITNEEFNDHHDKNRP